MVILLISLFMLTQATVCFCAGTGDDPTPTNDVLTQEEARLKKIEEAKYQKWLKEKNTKSKHENSDDMKINATSSGWLYAPSHAQQRAYWCGPATCQIIDNYWGFYEMLQQTYANFLATTTNGTDFSKVDDALRYYTLGKSYYYYGPLSSSTDFF